MRRAGARAFVSVVVAAVVAVACAGFARAADVSVAIAANFTEPAKEIAAAFARTTGHKPLLSFGATGQFFAQISQGAPFEVFLAADQSTPKKAVDDGFAVSGSQFTYAVGKLVLFSVEPKRIDGEKTLKDGAFSKIAIANPSAAPYGAAAIATMKALGVYEKLAPKIVQGANIAQAYQFVDTRNAEVGFVALSQVVKRTDGSRWSPPQNLYPPIKQDAALLKRGEASEAAKMFFAYLRSPEAVAIIERYGYAVD